MTAEKEPEILLADLTSGDEERAEAAAQRLAEIGAPVLPALERLLESEVTDHRWWAVRTLGQMSLPRTDLLVRALADGSSEVRAAAALALSTHPAEEAAGGLVKLLE